MRYITLLLVCLLITSVPTPNYGGMHNTVAGFTTCTGKNPQGWVDSELVVDSLEFAVGVAIHEQVHVEQMEDLGGCDIYLKTQNDSLALEMEAEAFYVEAVYSVDVGIYANMEVAIAQYAWLLIEVYGFEIDYEEAYAKIWSFAPEEDRPLELD